MPTYRVVGICGSLREASINRTLLRLATSVAPPALEVQEVGLRDIPMFNADVLSVGMPRSVQKLRSDIREADAVVIATPEYNFSIPGVLKNALDWVSRGEDQPLAFKPVAILSASPGLLGGARVQYDLRKVLLFVNASVVVKPEVFVGGFAGKFDSDGNCTDETTRRMVADLMASLQLQIERTCRMLA